MNSYLAIGTLASGKSFRYRDKAKDIKAFIDYVIDVYPGFEIDAVISL